MRGINKVILVDTLGTGPDIKYTPNQQAMANLCLANSDEWDDKSSDQNQQKTEWHRVMVRDCSAVP